MPTSERSLPGFKAFFTRSLNAAQKGLASNADKDTLIQLTKSLHDSYLKYESCVNDIMKDDSIESTVQSKLAHEAHEKYQLMQDMDKS